MRTTTKNHFSQSNHFPVYCFLLLAALFAFSPAGGLQAQVRVYEGQETIPTYKRGPDVMSPIFYTGRGVQGAAGHFYPYPAQISLSDDKTDVTYDMVYLENEYVKVTIIPAMGGRLFSAVDKTNGQEIFHRNTTVKPDLIGTLGAWISGGIEWCYPHHHRSSTFIPADYRIVENPDGSATVWVGETERTLGLRGVVGMTLHPGRSYIDVDYRLNNPTPFTRNFKFWANVAVPADSNYRSFWPPSQEITVFHNNSAFAHWPISHENYRGTDYSDGVDLTWWKNHPSPVSFFWWKGDEGFIGGYNYGTKAGIVHVGDTYKSRISKVFLWGPGERAQMARKKLTDDNKAYVELMTGSFSNNQPDYSWFAPHMVKHDKHYWYPIQDIEMAKNASRDAAITLQMRDRNTVFYGVNTTLKMENTRVVLSYNGEVVASDEIDVDPANPFTATWKSRREVDESLLHLGFYDAQGNELLAYTPYQKKNPELPEEWERFGSPSEYETVEDLYLIGRSVKQFRRPYQDPEDYYLRALEMSPDDYRVNLAMGIHLVDEWRFAEAEEHLERAALKLQYEYMQPKEGELFYYWAIAQRAQGKIHEAFRNFSYAAYHYAWYSAANYQLAQMENERGNTVQALKYIDDAYSTNNRDGGIVVLYSALLRQAERGQEALEMIDKALEFDPLNYALMYERYLITGRLPIREMQDKMQDVENNYIEIATNYLDAGMYDEAIRLFSEVKDPQNPMFLYYSAFAMAQNGNESKAEEIVVSAGTKSFDYIFPHRMKSESVLRYAIDADPDSPYGYYLLGNLLYDFRPEEAVEAWNSALEIDGNIPMVLRNLAFGTFYLRDDADNAIDYLSKAIQISPDNAIWYTELDRYYDASDRDSRECLDILEANIEIIKRDVSAPQALVKLLNLYGKYDDAVELLDSHHFRTWEGGRIIHEHYVNAHVLKALELMDEGEYQEALGHLNRATEYPENLEVGRSSDSRNAMIDYLMANVYEKMGKTEDALRSYESCLNAGSSRSSADLMFYQGLSNKKTGNTSEANEVFNRLETRGKEMMESSGGGPGIGVVEDVDSDRRSQSEGYYLQGLASLGKGKSDEALELFTKALDLYNNNLWAKYYMNNHEKF